MLYYVLGSVINLMIREWSYVGRWWFGVVVC